MHPAAIFIATSLVKVWGYERMSFVRRRIYMHASTPVRACVCWYVHVLRLERMVVYACETMLYACMCSF